LTDVLQQEKQPFLVAGDFNTPANGYIWDLLRANLSDVFHAKGRGYGFTLPGDTKNPLSFFGPWLRVDYLFSGKSWRSHWCRVESSQPAQHLAVVAKFELEKLK
jgi:endonuclease/exonuclease/phosphatase family metal-dependent hydrolase